MYIVRIVLQNICFIYMTYSSNMLQFIHSMTTTMPSLLFLEYAWDGPTLGTLHWLMPLPGRHLSLKKFK